MGVIARATAVAAIAALHAVRAPLPPPDGTELLVFIASDCPVSNAYAPEIQRICRDYAGRGVRCTLVYEDPGITPGAVRAHLAEYGYGGIDTRIDASGAIARKLGATVTPEAAVVDTRGAIRYRGRIDNFHAALGKPRQQVTSRDLRDALDAVVANRTVARPRTPAIGCYITTGQSGRRER